MIKKEKSVHYSEKLLVFKRSKKLWKIVLAIEIEFPDGTLRVLPVLSRAFVHYTAIESFRLSLSE